MTKRGPKPKELIKIDWSENFSYALGLLATDGCVSKDGLLIDLTSKDQEQLKNFMKCLNIKLSIGTKYSSKGDRSFRIQFKNRLFYDFLLSIGFSPAKSKTIKKINIPPKYFFDFLRGCFDGDGYTYSYWDPRWRNSYMFYTGFVSASKIFLEWIQKEVEEKIHVKGNLAKTNSSKKTIYYQLKYAKNDSLNLLQAMFYRKNLVYLKRKKLKIDRALAIVNKQFNAQVA